MMTASQNRALTLALGLAAATTFVTYQFMTKGARLNLAPRPQPVGLTSVLVPVADVAPLQLLRPSMFAARSLPANSVGRDAVVVPAELENKVALTALSAGQPVPRTALAARGPQLGLAFTVRPPRRAVTVALDPVIGVAGFPKPGNHVDVVVSINVKENYWVTRTVLEDVEILAMGADLQPAPVASASGKPAGASPDGAAKTQPTATLAVLPAEAQRLILAESCGKLRLALRAVDDTSHPKLASVEEAQLTGASAKQSEASRPAVSPRPVVVVAASRKPAAAPRKPAAPAAPHVVVVRGSQSEVVQVSRPGMERAAAPAPAAAAGKSLAPAAAPAPSDPNITGPGVQPVAGTALASAATPAQPAREGGIR